MNDQDLRFECLRLAIAQTSASMPAVDLAQKFYDFVKSNSKPEPKEALKAA